MGNNKSSTNGVQYLNAPDAAGQRQIARCCRRRYRMRHAICQPRHSSAPRRRTAGLRGLLGCGPTRRWPGVRAAYLWRSVADDRVAGAGGSAQPSQLLGLSSLGRRLGVERREIGDFGRASRPHRSLRSDPGRCSVAGQVRSAARSLESRPQGVKVVGRGR